jgi:site-specific DNA-methyltransferase (adenine-specific)
MLEKNKIYNGDCLEIMKSIEDKSVDMILCDLPYGTTACKWDVIIPFEPLWEQYKRIIKDNGAIVLTASQPFTSALVMSNVKMFKYEWIWNKKQSGSFLLAKYQPLKITESVCVFSKGKTNYSPQMRTGKLRKKGGSKYKSELYANLGSEVKYNDQYFPTNIVEFSLANKSNRTHPTQKPVALFEYLIKTYTNEGETVLDNCSGSGTTAIACINTNRNYICIEKDKTYFDKSVERVEKHLEQQNMFRKVS